MEALSSRQKSEKQVPHHHQRIRHRKDLSPMSKKQSSRILMIHSFRRSQTEYRVVISPILGILKNGKDIDHGLSSVNHGSFLYLILIFLERILNSI